MILLWAECPIALEVIKMLSPWLQPSAINSPLQAAAALGFGGYDNNGSLDKRDGDAMAIRNRINEYKTIADTITNALGNRSPYYIIGEIPSETGELIDKYGKWLGSFGGAVRAVSDLVTGKKQDGVIIDCLGDINGEISIEFTNNPVLYKTNQSADGRLRKPNVVNAVVAVSNFNNDDLFGMALDTFGALDPSGLVGGALNALLEDGNTRAQNALYKLRGLQETGEAFKVYTPHGTYENMLIESIKPLTNASTMDMLYATITFKEVIFSQPYFSSARESKAVPARKNIKEMESGDLWDKTVSKIDSMVNFF